MATTPRHAYRYTAERILTSAQQTACGSPQDLNEEPVKSYLS